MRCNINGRISRGDSGITVCGAVKGKEHMRHQCFSAIASSLFVYTFSKWGAWEEEVSVEAEYFRLAYEGFVALCWGGHPHKVR